MTEQRCPCGGPQHDPIITRLQTQSEEFRATIQSLIDCLKAEVTSQDSPSIDVVFQAEDVLRRTSP